MTSCALSLCVRASHLRFWTFKVTFHPQWKARILMQLTILAEVEFSFCFSHCWSAVPYHFARAGVVFESLYCWGHFSCSVTAENPNGIDDVGWSWVFDVWRCWLKLSVRFCFCWMMLRVECFEIELCTLGARVSYLRVWTSRCSLRSVSCVYSFRGMP